MSTWSNLSNSKWISYKDIQNGVLDGSISLYTGASISYTDQWVNKLSFSNSVPNLGTLSYFNKLDNQWITKTDIIPGMECPCEYSATYSNVFNNYNCVKIDKATTPIEFLQIDKVQNGYWGDAYYSRLYSGLDGFGQTGSDIFTGITVSYTNFATYSGLNYQLWNNTHAYSNAFGDQGSTSVDYSGRMNYCGIWGTGSHPGGGADWTPINQWIGFVYNYNSMTASTFYLGIAGDDVIRCTLNGIKLIDNTTDAAAGKGGVFTQWNIYPIPINIGVNNFTFEVNNGGVQGGFGAEVYNFGTSSQTTVLSILNSATNSLFDDQYVVFSTKNKVGQYWDYGNSVGYYCSNGGSLYQNPINNLYMCQLNATQSAYSLSCPTNQYFTMDTDQIYSSATVSFTIQSRSGFDGVFVDWGDGSTVSWVDLNPVTYSVITGYPYGTSSLSNVMYQYYAHTYSVGNIYKIKVSYIYLPNPNGSGDDHTILLGANSNFRNFYYSPYFNYKPSGFNVYINKNLISDFEQNISYANTYYGRLNLIDNKLTSFNISKTYSFYNIDLSNTVPRNVTDITLYYNNKLTKFDPKYQIYDLSLSQGAGYGLKLDGNPLQSFNPTYYPLPNTLQAISLSLCGIMTYSYVSYSLPSNLKELNFSTGMGLRFFDPIYYDSFGVSQSALPDSLKFLYFNSDTHYSSAFYNKLTNFDPSFPLPKSLNTLDLSNNLITNFNPRFPLPDYINATWSGLQTIYLSANPMTSFNPSYSLPTSLTNIYFNGCSTLSYVNTSVFSNIIGLNNLNFFNCGLTAIPATLSNIKFASGGTLVLDLNYIRYIDNNVVFDDNISSITIQQNRVSLNLINPYNLPANLTTLKIECSVNNSLTTFPFDLINNTKIVTLSLKGFNSFVTFSPVNTLTQSITRLEFGPRDSARSGLQYVDVTKFPPRLNYLDMSYAYLTQSTVDSILVALSLGTVSNGKYYLQSQTYSVGNTSKPSAIGQSAISTLLSRGWTGSTD